MKREQNKVFFDRWASTYDFSLFQFWMKRFHRAVLDEIDQNKPVSLLDISCGTGELLRELKDKNITLEGIDYAEKMLKRAKEKLPASIKLQQGDVHYLPYKKNTFDLVVSTEAFHHYHDQTKALQEMARVSKGKVMVVDINFFLPAIHWLFEKLEPGCVRINNKQEMRTVFERAGLKEIRQKRSFLFAVATMGRKHETIPMSGM